MKQKSRVGAPETTHKNTGIERDPQVRLSPFLGVSPGAYLTVIYGLAVFLALFMVLLYPGLRSPGGKIEITASPRHVSVAMNGRFLGTTPLSVQVAPGTHELELTHTNFASERIQVEVSKRIFGTLIIPVHAAAHTHLELLNAANATRLAVARFAGAWHATDILENAGHDLARADDADQYEFLHSALPFVDRRQALGALIRSATTAAAGGGLVTPHSIRRVFNWFSRLAKDYSGLPLWLNSTVSPELREPIILQRWYTEHIDQYQREIEFFPSSDRPETLPESYVLQDMRFRFVPEGILLMGNDVDHVQLTSISKEIQPHLRKVSSFLMADTEVTNRQFARFVAATPRWSPDSTDQLVSDRLAEPTYLAAWTNGFPTPGTLDEPVTHVSHHAATAFASWLDETLAEEIEESHDGLVVRLPTEAEWEWAARGGLTGQPYPNGTSTGNARLASSQIVGPSPVPSSEPNGYGLYDLLGNVWEWTSTWYAPASYTLAAGADQTQKTSPGQPVTGAERVVRGGSWATEHELIRVYSRGAQASEWTTPFLGFRVVLAQPDMLDG